MKTGVLQSKLFTIPGLLLLVAASLWVGSKMGGNSSTVHLDDHAAEGSEQHTEWTCSMHPQIKMPKEGKCPICFMDLIPLVSDNNGSDDDTGTTKLSMSENAKKLAGIATVAAVRQNVQAGIRMTGKVALDETRVQMISSRIAGRIDRLYVDFTGVAVKDGDALADIYSPELVSLQRELIEAASAVQRIDTTGSTLLQSATLRTLDAARNKLRLLGFSETDLLHLLNRGVPSDHMTIRAGQRGVVIRKLVEEGSYIQTGTPIVHIADLSKVWVMLDAYESDIAWIRVGQAVEFSVEAYPGAFFDGTVSFIDPIVNPSTRTVKVRVSVYNGSKQLKPDMFVKASLQAGLPQTANSQGRIIIPTTAPLFTGERSLVYVEVPDSDQPTYEGRNVLLGPKVGDYYVVNTGILEGERVVVNGAFKIDGELQIRAKPSMMNPAEVVTKAAGADLNSIKLLPEAVIATEPISKGFLSFLNTVTSTYMDIAQALANDDLTTTLKKMEELDSAISTVKATKKEQYAVWTTAKKEMMSSLAEIKQKRDISNTRQVFNLLSKQVIALEKQYLKDDGANHFLAFCPMAFNNTGAYWIQTDESIRNPYFGAKMLKCGEIRDSL